MTPDQLDRAAISLRAGDYNLLLGAAASLGSTNGDGSPLPLADQLRLELCALEGAKTGNSLQRIYQTLAAYAEADAYQIPDTKNFRDPHEDVRDNSKVPIIHLHGFAQRPQDGYSFLVKLTCKL